MEKTERKTIELNGVRAKGECYTECAPKNKDTNIHQLDIRVTLNPKIYNSSLPTPIK